MIELSWLWTVTASSTETTRRTRWDILQEKLEAEEERPTPPPINVQGDPVDTLDPEGDVELPALHKDLRKARAGYK